MPVNKAETKHTTGRNQRAKPRNTRTLNSGRRVRRFCYRHSLEGTPNALQRWMAPRNRRTASPALSCGEGGGPDSMGNGVDGGRKPTTKRIANFPPLVKGEDNSVQGFPVSTAEEQIHGSFPCGEEGGGRSVGNVGWNGRSLPPQTPFSNPQEAVRPSASLFYSSAIRHEASSLLFVLAVLPPSLPPYHFQKKQDAPNPPRTLSL
ncbi:general secretion pathway gspf-related protein [Anopheles sinensis]|uniref:General secretion pathway gspf-related protein n=1 Tax=Anopheles sinensis TaxID=74873 RepID=A0A084WFK0_ANOSI|nr:general secretion pathway gspf-related protein [Anopheles sinensis]